MVYPKAKCLFLYTVLVLSKAERGYFSSVGRDIRQKLTKYRFMMRVALLYKYLM
jgi:hypothetical protein